jgi:hypothetical protein
VLLDAGFYVRHQFSKLAGDEFLVLLAAERADIYARLRIPLNEGLQIGISETFNADAGRWIQTIPHTTAVGVLAGTTENAVRRL